MEESISPPSLSTDSSRTYWEEILSFDLASRRGCCIVAKDAHLYFIGGANASTNADRFDLTTNKWDKIADIQKGRSVLQCTEKFSSLVDYMDWTAQPVKCITKQQTNGTM